MKTRVILPLLVIGILLAFGSSTQIVTLSQEQLTEEEAANLFQQLGCTSCHMPNGAAKSFEDILSKMAQMAKQYNGDIDAYTKETVEYFGGQKFNSYEEMMKVMQGNVGASDEDMAKLNAFFKNYFEAAAKGEVEQQEAPQETAAQEEQPAKEEAAPAEQPAEKPKSSIPAIVFGVAAIVIIAVLLVVFTAKK